jgi:hypothetical protein
METKQPPRGEELPELTDGADIYFGNVNNNENKLIKPWLTETIRAMEAASQAELATPKLTPEQESARAIAEFSTKWMRDGKVTGQDLPPVPPVT